MFTCFSALLYICCAEMEPENVALVVPLIEKRPEEIGYVVAGELLATGEPFLVQLQVRGSQPRSVRLVRIIFRFS